MEQALEELQDKLWDLDKVDFFMNVLLSILISQSWENNLMFRGIIIITIIITIIFIIIIILIIIMNSQSWENNLVFYGINIMKDEEHNPDLITGRVRLLSNKYTRLNPLLI